MKKLAIIVDVIAAVILLTWLLAPKEDQRNHSPSTLVSSVGIYVACEAASS